jgi:hypothetical protein
LSIKIGREKDGGLSKRTLRINNVEVFRKFELYGRPDHILYLCSSLVQNLVVNKKLERKKDDDLPKRTLGINNVDVFKKLELYCQTDHILYFDCLVV